MPEENKLYLECDCSSKSHLVCVELEEWEWKDGAKSLDFTIETQMTVWATFWQRLWFAFLYVFKPHTRCRFGSWNCTLLNPERATELRDLLNEYISRTKELEDAKSRTLKDRT